MAIIDSVRIDQSFGDCIIASPAFRELSLAIGKPITVYTRPQYADAFHNLPFVKLTDQPGGIDFTPGNHFDRYKRTHGPHTSLLDVPWLRAFELGALPAHFDACAKRPTFRPTESELGNVAGFLATLNGRPVAAIESVHNSGQSWATRCTSVDLAVELAGSYDVLWLSHDGAPAIPGVHSTDRLTRRECILAVKFSDLFVTTGSGIFCGSLGLDSAPVTVCMWIDQYYKYERALSDLDWRKVIWAHDDDELRCAIASIKAGGRGTAA